MAKRKNIIFRIHDRLSFIAPPKAWLVESRPLLSTRRLCFLVYLMAKRMYHKDYSFDMPEESSVPIDIFMPTLEKDAQMLDLAVDFARKNIKHPITNIYIVSSGRSTKLRKLAKQKNCVFVDEKSVLDIDKEKIGYSFDGFNKNGWIYKMLLNLNAHKVCSEDNILVLDSDTLFIAPQIFMYKGKPLFNLSNEYHQPYFDANKTILGIKHKISRSFITHYMLFNRQALEAMHRRLEEKWSKVWYKAIIDNLDKSTPMAFADYESYGDFYLHLNPRGAHLNYWSNASHELKDIAPDKLVARALKNKIYRSVSLHTYKKKSMEDYEK